MDDADTSFSDRFGYHEPEVEISVREDAPTVVRDGVLMLGYAAGFTPEAMRNLLCQVLLTRPDPNNWSPSNVEHEVSSLIEDAPWFKIYDFAERLYAAVGKREFSGDGQNRFEGQLNQLFREKGIGWEMKQGSSRYLTPPKCGCYWCDPTRDGSSRMCGTRYRWQQ